jgi:two-component system chemotaxis response regulator CheB
MEKQIKVLIIDDSALVREVLTKVLSGDKSIQVIGTASDPLHAIKQIKTHKPDVLSLDLEMPKMDGLTFLEKLMSIYPMPVVVVSSLAQEGSKATIKALELGAVEYVSKPKVGIGSGLEKLSEEIISKIKAAADVNMEEVRRIARRSRMTRMTSNRKESTELREDISIKPPLVNSTDKIIAIGASTGGTVAIKNILQNLPANMPGIAIVLHMPAGFTASYAESLNAVCRIKVKEAVHNEPFLRGHAYVAPGGKHMLLEKRSGSYYIKLDNGPPINRHIPSVDKTFFSIAETFSPNALGIILTGMGDDGARGILAMHKKGSPTIAQDEKTSIVFGMPRQAIKLGAIDNILPLENIAEYIIRYINNG